MQIVGQKVSAAGVVSTYSLVYTASANALSVGGVLAPNGDIHFAPNGAPVGQKFQPLVLFRLILWFIQLAKHIMVVLLPQTEIFILFLLVPSRTKNFSGWCG
jgi:hypothetical protein